MKLFPSLSKESVKIKDLQKQVNNLTNAVDEQLEKEEEYALLEKSIIDSDDSNMVGEQFGLVDEQYDKTSLQKLYMTETWFYIVVSTIAKSIASLPYKIEKKKIIKQNITHVNGQKEEVYKEVWIDASAEPECDLFKYPNELQIPMEFWMLVVIDLLATGDAYIYAHKSGLQPEESNSETRLRNAISRVRKTDVDSLFRINSALVEIVPSTEEGKIIDSYQIVTKEKQLNFSPEDIIHIKLPNPSNPFYGLAPIVAVMKKVLLDRYTDEHHIRFYKQGARLGGAIETTKKLTKEQMQRLTKTFEANFTGKRQHHKTLVLPEGMSYKVIEQSPVDSSLIEFAKMNKEPILSAYNVPPVKIGLLDGATFANAMIQNKTYYIDTIMPLTKMLEQAINSSETILKSSRGLRFSFDFTEIEALQQDYKLRAETAKSMVDSGLTVNEVREMVWKKGPLEGGDVTPYLKTNTSSFFGLSTEPKEIKTDANNAQNDTLALSDIIPTEATFQSRVAQLINEALSQGIDLGLATGRAIEQAIQEGFKPAGDKTIVQPEVKIQAPFSKEAIANYMKATTGDGVSELINDRRKLSDEFFKRLANHVISKIKKKAYRKSFGFAIKAVLPTAKDVEKKFIEEESKRIAEGLIKSSYHGYKTNIPNKSLTFNNDEALYILKSISTRNVTSVVKSSLDQMKNIITSSYSEQVSVNELSSRIRDVFDDISASKGLTISRTETLTAVSVGQDLKTRNFKAQYPKDAKNLKRVWMTSEDEKVRPTHEDNNGVVVDVGEDFPNGLKYPRDPNGSAEEVINCRCSFIDYLPEDEDTILNTLSGSSLTTEVNQAEN
jgi:HK97 family phage portal protein